MYRLWVCFVAGWIGPTKSIPHFLKGANGIMGTNDHRVVGVGLPILWQLSHFWM